MTSGGQQGCHDKLAAPQLLQVVNTGAATNHTAWLHPAGCCPRHAPAAGRPLAELLPGAASEAVTTLLRMALAAYTGCLERKWHSMGPVSMA
jgi:hypothetical protein